MLGQSNSSAGATAIIAPRSRMWSGTTTRDRPFIKRVAVPRPTASTWSVVPGAAKLVAGLACVVHLAVMVRLWGPHQLVEVMAVGIVSMLLAAAALIDHAAQRIPNDLLSWGAIALLVAAALGGSATLDHIAVGVALAALPMLIVLLTRGIGIGDVKMAAVVGGAAGIVHPLAAIGAVFAMALASGLYGMATGRHRVALGPWLWGGLLASTTATTVTLHLLGDAR